MSCTFRSWAQLLAYHNFVVSMRRAIIYKLKVLNVLFGETFTFESICFLLFTGKAEIDVTIANVLSVCWMWNWFFDRHGLFCEFFFWTPKFSQKYETLKWIKWKSNGWRGRGGWLAKICTAFGEDSGLVSSTYFRKLSTRRIQRQVFPNTLIAMRGLHYSSCGHIPGRHRCLKTWKTCLGSCFQRVQSVW